MEEQAPPATAAHFERNPGIPLDLGWINNVHVNRSAVERRAASHFTRRAVKKQWQLAWELRAITCVDLTTLSGTDTPGNVHRLCHKAIQPVRQDILQRCQVNVPVHVGAVCVYSARVADAVKALEGSGIPVASVATGFPHGQTPLHTRLAEIEYAVKAGAKEIDIVISRELAINSKWEEMYDEVKQMRKACGDAHLKTILATGELPTFRHVYKASLACMMAGADFIKTSTGMESVNATLPFGFVMCRAIREYYERTGYKVGFKPAGGIRSAKVAVSWLVLMFEELGEEWTHPNLFRIGASALVTDIERQLWHGLTGEYAAFRYMPKS